MKITEVQALALAIPFAPMDPPSTWTAGVRKQVLVRLATDDGLVGWGEAFALGAPLAVCAVVEEALRPLLVGEDPLAIERLTDKLHRATFLFGRRGVGMMAISGVELALWDLAGRAHGVSVSRLLGGAGRARVPAYASLLRYDRPEQVAAAAVHAVAAGFRAVKLHQTDVASVAAARAAVGPDVALMLDVNCPWAPDEAIRIGRLLRPYDLAWLEEPVWPPEDYAGLARVAAALDTPVAAGENEATAFGFRDLIGQRAAAIVQPSVIKVGGLGEARKVAALAAAANVTLVPHSFYFGPGLAATLHLCGATPGIPWVEFPGGVLATPLLTEPIQAVGGEVAVPTGPGLGVTVNEAALRRHPYGPDAVPFTIAAR
jgi:L-alanine-DL-glutamate epimerase-like enolase superfamily enzyme